MLIGFHGYEGEDFCRLLETLEAHFVIINIYNNRKSTIFKAQLRVSAKVYDEKSLLKKGFWCQVRTGCGLLGWPLNNTWTYSNYELDFSEI